eukprot:m.255276 g.255276  ORF g.255276 m.255276 type:complete len:143 (-) comp15945_c0_seq1:2838-3266(-)
MLQALALGLVWVVAGSAGAPAGSKEGSILCRGSAASFQATMSTAGWAPGSGFFNLVDASIMDNYNGGKLTCMGSKLGQEINCVGFNNGLGDAVFYVTLTAANPPTASYTMLKGAPGPGAGVQWPCSVTPPSGVNTSSPDTRS